MSGCVSSYFFSNHYSFCLILTKIATHDLCAENWNRFSNFYFKIFGEFLKI